MSKTDRRDGSEQYVNLEWLCKKKPASAIIEVTLSNHDRQWSARCRGIRNSFREKLADDNALPVPVQE
jgi:hypothetical protein